MLTARITRAGASLAVALSFLCADITAVSAADKAPVNVGLVVSKSGLLGVYGNEYLDGFNAGLAYATHGTGTVNGHKIVVSDYDDGGDPAKAVATAKDLIGQGYKIIAGSTSSGVAVQMAPIAKENNVLFISGPAATDAVTGANRNTFRSGRQTYQDVLAVGTVLGTNLRGKKITVFAQDSAFGQANVNAARAVLGGEGATVNGLLVPLSANDFSPFAQKVLDEKPDLLFIAWAGTSGPAMFKSLEDAGVLNVTRVVTGLDQRASFSFFGPQASKIFFLSHYLAEASTSAPNKYLVSTFKAQGKVPEIFDNDGFVAAEMIVHAVAAADGDDVGKMTAALEGYKFTGPKGSEEIRTSDHAVLQPMFIVQLVKEGSDDMPRVLRTLSPGAVAPPVRAIK